MKNANICEHALLSISIFNCQWRCTNA